MGTILSLKIDSSSEVNTQKHRKILIVDDDALNLRVLTSHMKREGYEVLGEGNGEKGLASFIANAPDVVLTDRQMPNMDGERMAKEIRKLKPDAHIILMSGSDLSNIPPVLFNATLNKPFPMESLRGALAMY